jgi:hypothetical protein
LLEARDFLISFIMNKLIILVTLGGVVRAAKLFHEIEKEEIQQFVEHNRALLAQKDFGQPDQPRGSQMADDSRKMVGNDAGHIRFIIGDIQIVSHCASIPATFMQYLKEAVEAIEKEANSHKSAHEHE